jgi:hypothetical protein
MEHVQNVGKMLHKLFEIYMSITVQISRKSCCNNFLLGKLQPTTLTQTLGILRKLKHSILVTVILLKSSKKLHFIQLNHLLMLLLQLTLMSLSHFLLLEKLIKLKIRINILHTQS